MMADLEKSDMPARLGSKRDGRSAMSSAGCVEDIHQLVWSSSWAYFRLRFISNPFLQTDFLVTRRQVRPICSNKDVWRFEHMCGSNGKLVVDVLTYQVRSRVDASANSFN